MPATPPGALERRLKQSGDVLLQAALAHHSNPPEILFHYTNSAGVTGILDSSRLWATNFRFLNDRSEIGYGMALFESVVEERLASGVSPVVADFLGRTLNTANAFQGMLDCYVACFCERDDLLNQWRVYAGSGGGYAIGFLARDLGHRWGQRHPTQEFLIRKVVYDPAIQRRLLSEVIDVACNTLEEEAKGLDTQAANLLIASCCHFARNHISEYLIYFKHEAFEVEQEWRLCHLTTGGDEGHVDFRNGSYGLTPYVAVDPSPMAGIHHNRLPIHRITHGPSIEPENVRFALSKLLRIKGYAFVEVGGSVLPVRVGP